MLAEGKKTKLEDRLVEFMDENPPSASLEEMRQTHVGLVKMVCAAKKLYKSVAAAAVAEDPAEEAQSDGKSEKIDSDMLLAKLMDIFDTHAPFDHFELAALLMSELATKDDTGGKGFFDVLVDSVPDVAAVVHRIWASQEALETFMRSRFSYMLILLDTAPEALVQGTPLQKLRDVMLPDKEGWTLVEAGHATRADVHKFWASGLQTVDTIRAGAVVQKTDAEWRILESREYNTLKASNRTDLQALVAKV